MVGPGWTRSWRRSASEPSGWTMAWPVRPCFREFWRDLFFAGFGSGAGGFLGVLAVGVDLGFGGHGLWRLVFRGHGRLLGSRTAGLCARPSRGAVSRRWKVWGFFWGGWGFAGERGCADWCWGEAWVDFPGSLRFYRAGRGRLGLAVTGGLVCDPRLRGGERALAWPVAPGVDKNES